MPGVARVRHLSVAIFATALLAAARPAQAERTFSELVGQWSELSLQGPGRHVQGLRLSAGHLTLVLASGDAAPVLAGDEVVGVYFHGTGSMEYLSVDPIEFPVVTHNVRKNTDLSAVQEGSGLAIRDTFKEVLWLAGGMTPPILPAGPAGNPLERFFVAHRKKFNQVYASPIEHQFAASRLNGSDRPIVRAEIAGGSTDLVYVLDAQDSRSEALLAPLESRAIDDRLNLVVLSDQPVGCDRRDPVVPPVILAAVDLALTAPDARSVALSVTETLVATTAPVSVVRLDLYDTRYVPSNLGRPEPRRWQVKGVFDEGGAALAFNHRKDEIAIGFPTPLQPGVPRKVRFDLEGDILFRPGGDNYWELGTEPWFPQADLSGQHYTVHATVKVKKPFVPLVPGKTVRRVEEGEWNVLETRLDRPVQFMVVLAGKYAFEEETEEGVTVRVASYAVKDTRAIRKLMNLTRKVIDYYEGFLGPFPFEEFNVVEINAWGFGQAPPGFMLITSEAFHPIAGDVNQLFSKGINERFSHEIAHQYWGYVVKVPSVEEQWLSESFAEMCAGLFIRDLRGADDLEGLIATWRSRAKEASETAPIPLANRIRSRSDSVTAARHRAYLLYSKGPWLLNSIRRQIGERPFLVFLNSCQSTFQWRFGNTKMVQAILEAITKSDWKPFFDTNYWGTGMPER